MLYYPTPYSVGKTTGHSYLLREGLCSAPPDSLPRVTKPFSKVSSKRAHSQNQHKYRVNYSFHAVCVFA